MKRKNDYYYIIKLGIFQRKSEETRRLFPNGTLLPGTMRLSQNAKKHCCFCATRQRCFWVIDKKKKKFYDFCVSCHIKTEESANQSKGCDAKLKGLEYGSQPHFLNHTAHGHHLKGGRSPKYKTQSVVPAIWPVRRFFCFVQAWLYFGSNS